MDHSFPPSATRHSISHHGSSVLSNQNSFRVSPGGNRSNSSSSQSFNSSSSIFGSAHNPISSLFDSANTTGNSNPGNLFNFPLRSNRIGNIGTGFNTTNGIQNRNLSQINRNNNPRPNNSSLITGLSPTNMNKSRPNPQCLQQNVIPQPPLNLQNGQNSSSACGISVQNSTGSVNSREVSLTSGQQQPQYRIFKRGDTIPGITSPTSILHAGSTGNHSNNNPIGTDIIEAKPANTSLSEKENFAKVGSSFTTEFSDGNNINIKPQHSSNASRTPISLVGDIARFHGLKVEYRLTKETGPPHAPTFTVVLHLGPEEKYEGQGSSIKRAQHAAAAQGLDKTVLSQPPPKTQSKARVYGHGHINNGNPQRRSNSNWAILQLTTIAEELKETVSFVQQPVTIVDPIRRVDPPSIISVTVGDKVFTGEGPNISAAKNMAATLALKAVLKLKHEKELAKLVEEGKTPAQLEEQHLDAENKSPISVVHEMAMKRGLNVTFEVTSESGPPHLKVFTVKCSVGDNMETEGQGPTKQTAKKVSSENMIEKLKGIPLICPAGGVGLSLKAMQRGLLRAKTTRKKSSTPVVKELEKQIVSPISRLIQIAHVKKYKEPEFALVGQVPAEDPASVNLKGLSERDRRSQRRKKPVFTMEVTVGPHTCRGAGPNKKAAKKNAADAAIVALGYGPIEQNGAPASEKNASGKSEGKSSSAKPNTKGTPESQSKTPQSNSEIKITSARQLVPGVLVIKSETPAGQVVTATSNAVVAQEMIKVNSMPPPVGGTARDGVDKLNYLARLLDVTVSYSDFPKKNEFLSVVSLATAPPHVAHGCGCTLEEAQNSAAHKILEELSDVGLDSVEPKTEKLIHE